MASSLRLSAYPAPGPRSQAIQQGREAQASIRQYEQKTGEVAPPYELLELIGKGAYGRVYKSRNIETNQIVAIKIVGFDAEDIEQITHKDQYANLRDIQNEIRNLTALKDSGAKNINRIYEALSYRADIWLITEYSSGGSLNTLMKPFHGSGLPEKYVAVVARELAIGLDGCHRANIIHRDVKSGNVLISASGGLEVADFGISTLFEADMPNAAKRTTMIGTPHWMAPEMLNGDVHSRQVAGGYDNAVDVWAYGATLVELATGHPPFPDVSMQELAAELAKNGPPRLDPTQHSQELCDFVAFVLVQDIPERPKFTDILQHPYIVRSAEFPREILKDLVEKMSEWESQGGNRASLFVKSGDGDALYDIEQTDADWNFSEEHDEEAELIGQSRRALFITDYDRQRHEVRTKDVADNFGRLFDPHASDDAVGYEFKEPPVKDTTKMVGVGAPQGANPSYNDSSDVGKRRSEVKSVMIDLDELLEADDPSDSIERTVRPTDTAQSFIFDDDGDDEDAEWEPSDPTLKRQTMAWTFADAVSPPPPPTQEKRQTMAWTFADAHAPAQQPQGKRETLAWSFADAQSQPLTAKRGTMSWSFADASTAPSESNETQTAPEESSFKFPPSPTMEGSGYEADFDAHVMTPELDMGPGSDTEPDESSSSSPVSMRQARGFETAAPAPAAALSQTPSEAGVDDVDEERAKARAERLRQFQEVTAAMKPVAQATTTKMKDLWGDGRAKRYGAFLRSQGLPDPDKDKS